MSSVATINGVPILSSSPVRWQLTTGVKPFETEIDLRPVDAENLIKGPMTPVVLVLSDGDKRKATVNGVYVTMRGVGENPNISRVVLVDRRWFWSSTHVERHYNVRRVVGSKRQKSPDTPPELDPLDPKISYAPFSLKDGKPWTALQILTDVMAQLMDVEGRENALIDPALGSLLDNLPIEDLELSDPGDVALRRVLSYLPEAVVYVDLEGRVRVQSGVTGSEEAIIHEAGPESVGLGHVEFISNARIRPSQIHVLFTREHEVRFDFEESDSPTYTEDQRYMDNVLPIPDYQLTLKSPSGQALAGDPVRAQGTWIPFPTAFGSWGAPPRMTNLTSAAAWYPAVRRYMVPYHDLWTAVGANGARAFDADWMGRISAIQSHFRRTFRINHRWMARILQLKACKVATIDPTTGTRAPALAYADYCRVASQRALYLTSNREQGAFYCMNVKSSPDSATSPTTRPPAPATVVIADHDQGILHIDFHPDIYRMYEMLLPSMMELDGGTTQADKLPGVPGPTGDIDDTNTTIAFNGRGETHTVPQLTANHSVALVLTAIPAGSNNPKAEQLYKYVVNPSDVTSLLPDALERNISESYGPILQIRINATIETARVAWDVNRADDIEAAFGIGDKPGNIDDLIINKDGDVQGGASLKGIALAVAARTWAALTDRWEGSKTVALRGATTIGGNVESVTHEVTTTGATQTSIELPGQLPSIDLFSLLPESTRRIVLRLAPSPGKLGK